ncbi:septation protein A [Parvibium lacunae]|uniref:Inner membrane-spanning protein YciB n=1 Tax=Parvibium lacunae TaxID=1888893 RepID=A0A368L7J7_9BURK|nr:septation protein A [Parvibium lacunae]RCS59640.1 septation protein A [Parvibium lacunae]
MKLLFDFLPIVLFFAAFKWAEKAPTEAATFATDWLGPWVAEGVISPQEAPILLATALAIVVTIGQVSYLLLRQRRVEPMLWISLILITVFGGATIWLHSETFIKWKPTVLYGLFAFILLSGRLFGRNYVQQLMGAQLSLPQAVWDRLCTLWIGFFTVMAALNLWVASVFSTDTWVNFKLFGGIGLLLAFAIGQGLYLNRYLSDAANVSPAPLKKDQE